MRQIYVAFEPMLRDGGGEFTIKGPLETSAKPHCLGAFVSCTDAMEAVMKSDTAEPSREMLSWTGWDGTTNRLIDAGDDCYGWIESVILERREGHGERRFT